MKKIDILFPVDDKDVNSAVNHGVFEFQLTDIYGNKYISNTDFRGRFNRHFDIRF